VHGSDAAVLYSRGDDLVEATACEVHDRYRDFVASVVSRYLPAPALAELGAGYGSVVLDLARRPAFRGTPVFAAELTDAGSQLISELSIAEGLMVQTGLCDLTASPVTALPIPPGAVIYTSYAAQYVPRLELSFVESLASIAPSVVIHVEPCYEHCEGKTLLGLMRRRYIEVNDYNTNLVTVLREQRDRGVIDILEELPAVFGSNPLLAASVIVWRPLRRN
jgi:hypothetical protein